MAGTNLVRTTLTGVRPLGVRGEPLHTTHEQIRGVIRRRLGERHARLFAEPQPDDSGRRIDWYSDLSGAVRPLASLPEAERNGALADVGTLLADIAGLGAQLQQAPSADARITGRALELACRRPSDEYVFLVGDQPVVVCWGYEPEAAGTLLPPASAPAIVAEPVAAPVVAIAPPLAARAAAAPFAWLGWLVASALAVVLALATAYALRQFLPEAPTVTVTQLPPPPAPPAPPPPPNPLVGLQKDLGETQAEADRLRATLASLRDEFAAKRAACPPPKPPDPPPPPPKPPQVVEKKPEPPPPPPPKPQDPILKLPPKATNDYSFLKGCWRGDSFRYTPRHAPGHHTYCFDEHGNGQLVFIWQNGTTCRAPARARFQGDILQIADADTRCSDGSPWSQDRLICRPDASGVAQCSGETNLPSPGGGRNPATSFTVRLHRQ